MLAHRTIATYSSWYRGHKSWSRHDFEKDSGHGVTFLSCDPSQEEEAAWLSGCLLLPRSLLLAEVRSGSGAKDIAKKYGVSERMAQYRLDVTGVVRQNQAAMKRRRARP